MIDGHFFAVSGFGWVWPPQTKEMSKSVGQKPPPQSKKSPKVWVGFNPHKLRKWQKCGSNFTPKIEGNAKSVGQRPPPQTKEMPKVWVEKL